jgi:hypothetical protein
MSLDFFVSFPSRFIYFLFSAPSFFLALFSFLFPSFRSFHSYAHQCTDFFFLPHYTIIFPFNPITHSAVQNIEISVIMLVVQLTHSIVTTRLFACKFTAHCSTQLFDSSDELVESVLTPGTVIRQTQSSQKPTNILLSDNRLDER